MLALVNCIWSIEKKNRKFSYNGYCLVFCWAQVSNQFADNNILYIIIFELTDTWLHRATGIIFCLINTHILDTWKYTFYLSVL